MISRLSHSRHILDANNINISYISSSIAYQNESSDFLPTVNFGFGSRKQFFLQTDRLNCFLKEINKIHNESEMNYQHALQYYEGQKNYEKAVYYYRLAAEKGNINAQFSLGILYYCGIGMKESNKETAFKYLKQAAINGHPKAQYCYGICLANGEGIRMNKSKAVRYFRLSAENGYDEAQYCYARCLFNAFGIKQDYKEAAKYFRMAFEQGNPKAAFFYGLCLHQGLGVKEDKNEALNLLKYAADNKIDDAQKLIEIMEKTGTNYIKNKIEYRNQIQNENNENQNDNQNINKKEEKSHTIKIIPKRSQFKSKIETDDISKKQIDRFSKPVHYSDSYYIPSPIVK